MATRFFALTPIALAAALLPITAQAAEPAVQSVTVSGRGTLATPQVAGFGDVPLADAPLQAAVISAEQLDELGITSLAGITRLDASVSDSYNADGYWSTIAVRGYTLDPRFNYRRDGLPINAETVIPLGNKSGIEILKGASGIQAGTSAPGGLANFIVKRPDHTVRSAIIEWREDRTVGTSVDIGQRFGVDQVFGLRLNAGITHLDPQLRDASGQARFAAFAGDWRIGRDTLIEAEIEHSHQAQRSQPGFSMLGNVVPDARTIDPRINLNNQPWSLPVVFDNNTASLRWTQRLSDDWRFVAHGMAQALHTDDRLAYAFGCGREGNYDRYCSDGRYDLYDFRSEGEHRLSQALDLSVIGKAIVGGIEHQLTTGLLSTRFKSRLNNQTYNAALDAQGNPAEGTIDGQTVTLPDPAALYANTNRDERSTELYLRDVMRFNEQWSAWLGLRHSRLDRRSVKTFDDDGNGLAATAYRQSFTTPWLAISYAFAPHQQVYASWGQGIDSNVTPNKTSYANAGAPLPALRTHQAEVGAKGRASGNSQWSVAAFDIRRPFINDDGVQYFADGIQRHFGAEAQLEGRQGPFKWLASTMWLKARVEGGASNGLRPTNVPERTAKLLGGYDIAALPGLTLQSAVAYEGPRSLLPAADSPRIAGWTRFDAAARYTQRAGDTTLTWRVGVDNVADKRAWRESPYQYGHIYLYPMAPRTWRLSLQADL
jgi:iron complex outermembrane receptor protein